MLNFSQCNGVLESERPRVFRIDVTEAEKFPWVLRRANAGFIEGVLRGLSQRDIEVSIVDERADRFAYRVRVAA